MAKNANPQRIWENVFGNYRQEHRPWEYNPIPYELLNRFCDSISPQGYILDYGSGNGLLSKILFSCGFKVLACDISRKALKNFLQTCPNALTLVAKHPNEIYEKFDGILVWGVFHHIDIECWKEYLDAFYGLLETGGVLLVGGHSLKDSDFSSGSRVSPTTHLLSHALDSSEIFTKTDNAKFEILEKGYYNFREAFTNADRSFFTIMLRKISDK